MILFSSPHVVDFCAKSLQKHQNVSLVMLSVFSETEEKRFKNWNPPKKERPAEPIPKPPPPSVRNLKRDSVYKILHPYEFY